MAIGSHILVKRGLQAHAMYLVIAKLHSTLFQISVDIALLLSELQRGWLLSDQASERDCLGDQALGERIGYLSFTPIAKYSSALWSL